MSKTTLVINIFFTLKQVIFIVEVFSTDTYIYQQAPLTGIKVKMLDKKTNIDINRASNFLGLKYV